MFKDKVVVVTGAGSGIGKGIAQEFAKEGARVIIAEINEAKGKETEKEINSAGGQSLFIPTDVRKGESIKGLFAEVMSKWGALDVLVNNAGVSRWKSPLELTIEEWDDVLNINLRGYFLCAREGAKIMKEGGGGSIINIASTRAFMSEPHSEAYAASKGGIVALTHALAASLSDFNIAVNVISPGWIENKDYEGLREIDHQQHLSKRVGKPEDIAKACLFLASAENNFINGANLTIDGGMTRKMMYEE